MTTPRPPHSEAPFPRLQRQMVDWLALMNRQHTFHALLEVDVTDTRAAIKAYRARNATGLSFTAYFCGCFARAIEEHPRMHACRKGRGRLVVFEDVDLSVLVESAVEGDKIPVPHLLRGANRKTLPDLHRELSEAQSGDVPYATSRRWLGVWLLLPSFMRQLAWSWMLRDPFRRKQLMGTAVVSSVGMFGTGVAWAVPLTLYPVAATVGAIARRPAVVRQGSDGSGEHIAIREILSLTLSFDHDLIDGAPAARFAARLKDLLESGWKLDAPAETPADAT